MFHENSRVALVAMLLDQVIGFFELLQGRIKIDGLIDKVVLHEVRCGLLVFPLVGKDLSDEPLLIKSAHLIHLVSQLAQVNKFEISNPHEGFPGKREVLGKQGLNTECSPVLLGNADARDLIGHLEIFLLEESVEGGGLRDINGIHG